MARSQGEVPSVVEAGGVGVERHQQREEAAAGGVGGAGPGAERLPPLRPPRVGEARGVVDEDLGELRRHGVRARRYPACGAAARISGLTPEPYEAKFFTNMSASMRACRS